MRPIVTDLSVCLLITTASSAKTDEPIEVPFQAWTRVGLRNRSLGEGLHPPEGVIPTLTHSRYSQRYSLQAAAMRPLATNLLQQLVIYYHHRHRHHY